MRFAWLDAPKWAVATRMWQPGGSPWGHAGVLPLLGVLGFSLMLGGGLLYTLGAVVYALRRPEPWPAVFGYHEIFHSCVVLALPCT